MTSEELADTDLELPRIDYRRHNGRPYRYVYGGAVTDRLLGSIAKVDIERGEHSSWEEDGCFAGEPVFVPEPGAEGEDAGVLLSVVLDSRAETLFLLVLDAATLEERARAEVPHRIPLSFHGQFSGCSFVGLQAGVPSGAQLAAAVKRRLRWVAVLANTLGAIDVFLFLASSCPCWAGGWPTSAGRS